MSIRTWFYPSWSGDFRLVADGERSVLEIVEPTSLERQHLREFLRQARAHDWTSAILDDDAKIQNVALSTSVDDAGKLLLPIISPPRTTITAIRSEGGKVTVHDTAALVAPKPEPALTGDVVLTKDVPEPTKKKAEDKAVSVKRPTPSCPQCVPGAIDRASEVLLSFLNPEEHEMWSRRRCIVVTGGLTGHRYALAHRHSTTAQRFGRICMDIDDGVVVHFHDNSVPPEEEVLAAKLILEHREPWLRNEATMLGEVYSDLHAHETFDGVITLPDGSQAWAGPGRIGIAQMVFKNPFGDFFDGTEDARVTQALGFAFGGLA